MRESVMVGVGANPSTHGKIAIYGNLPSTFTGKSGDELVTNLQGYLKVGNVNPQAVNFEINFYLYKFSAGI